MNSAFVNRIEEPDRLYFQVQQESAREAVRERLRAYVVGDISDYVHRKLDYTYYHD